MKYDTKEKARAKMDELLAPYVEAATADEKKRLKAWADETLEEAWRWSSEPAAPSLKAH